MYKKLISIFSAQYYIQVGPKLEAPKNISIELWPGGNGHADPLSGLPATWLSRNGQLL